MTKNLDLDGLQSIVDNYDLFYIDLWGVIHNGIKLNNSAIAGMLVGLFTGTFFVFLSINKKIYDYTLLSLFLSIILTGDISSARLPLS